MLISNKLEKKIGKRGSFSVQKKIKNSKEKQSNVLIERLIVKDYVYA